MRKYQKGLSAVSWIVVLGFVSFFVMFILKLAPSYIENWNVKTTLKSMREKLEGTNPDLATIREFIDSRLAFNNVQDVGLENISIVRDGNYYVIEAKYEVRRSFAANIDLIVSFDDSVEVRVR